jgi:hypothetical protein
MLTVKRRIAAASVAATLGLGGLAPLALATDTCPPPPPPPSGKAKCNAGNGNGSESTVTTGHCTNGDPGNSWFAGNRGGDETSFPGSVPNPGGNNAP